MDYTAIRSASVILWINHDYDGGFDPMPFNSKDEAVAWIVENLPGEYARGPVLITAGTLKLSLTASLAE